MHARYFPACPVGGPIEPPVPFGHLVLQGAVPQKCSQCQFLFEGECTRYFKDVGHYLNLDHGFCGIAGPTDPVLYRDKFIESEVPRKCASCHFLGYDQIRGLVCRKDKEKWGDFPRGLDWGNWQPDTLYLELPFPKLTTKELSMQAKNDDLIGFLKEYRRINPGISMQEAKSDFYHFRTILNKLSQKQD